MDSHEYLRHSLATLAYRGGKALRDAPDHFASFRVGETSRTPAEILAHICDLLDWALSFVRDREAWHASAPGNWAADVARFHAAMLALDEALAEDRAAGSEWRRLFQGPIADAFTHIGQLALLRRLAGSPVPGENYSRAAIVAGRVGLEQSAPGREFD
jgi:hypothetical protein